MLGKCKVVRKIVLFFLVNLHGCIPMVHKFQRNLLILVCLYNYNLKSIYCQTFFCSELATESNFQEIRCLFLKPVVFQL